MGRSTYKLCLSVSLLLLGLICSAEASKSPRRAAIPASCYCKRVRSPSKGICLKLTNKDSDSCVERPCKPSYTCVSGKRRSGWLCMRRRIKNKIVQLKPGHCATRKVFAFQYVPYRFIRPKKRVPGVGRLYMTRYSVVLFKHDLWGRDFRKLGSRSWSQCSAYCARDGRCTHWTFGGRTCFLKKGVRKLASAKRNKRGISGILRLKLTPADRYIVAKRIRVPKRLLRWQPTKIAVFGVGFNYPGRVIRSLRLPFKKRMQCPAICQRTKGCTHFTWAEFGKGRRHRAICWLQKGTRTMAQANIYRGRGRNVFCGIMRHSLVKRDQKIMARILGLRSFTYRPPPRPATTRFRMSYYGVVLNQQNLLGRWFKHSRVRTWPICAKLCSINRLCTHWTFSNRNCYFKKGPRTFTNARRQRNVVSGVPRLKLIPSDQVIVARKIRVLKRLLRWQPTKIAVFGLGFNYPGRVLRRVRLPFKKRMQCPVICQRTKGCTHFTWAEYGKGRRHRAICWLQKGARTMAQANIYRGRSRNVFCGIMRRNLLKGDQRIMARILGLRSFTYRSRPVVKPRPRPRPRPLPRTRTLMSFHSVVVVHRDLRGRDFRRVKTSNWKRCSTYCYRNRRCTHWTFHRRVCYLKKGRRALRSSVFKKGVVSGILRLKLIHADRLTVSKRIRVAKRFLSWEANRGSIFVKGYDLPGRDIRGVALPFRKRMHCASICLRTKGCTHFTWADMRGWRKRRGTCWLKRGRRVMAQATLYKGRATGIFSGILRRNLAHRDRKTMARILGVRKL